MKTVFHAATQMALRFMMWGTRIGAVFSLVYAMIRLASGGQASLDLLDPLLVMAIGCGGAGFIVGWALTAGGIAGRIEPLGMVSLVIPVTLVIAVMAGALVLRLGESLTAGMPLVVAGVLIGFTFILFASAGVFLYCYTAKGLREGREDG